VNTFPCSLSWGGTIALGRPMGNSWKIICNWGIWRRERWSATGDFQQFFFVHDYVCFSWENCVFNVMGQSCVMGKSAVQSVQFFLSRLNPHRNGDRWGDFSMDFRDWLYSGPGLGTTECGKPKFKYTNLVFLSNFV
jgi:hypothetical protein